jgi:hypothetical protein
MNKAEAAKELGISVRSLQRLAEKKVLTVIQRRGESGKLQTFFDAEDIGRYKQGRDAEIVKPAEKSTYDTRLARNDAVKFLEVFRDAATPQKPIVPIADKVLLNIKDCRLLTGLSEQMIRDAISEGKLKARVIGRGYKVKRQDLNLFVDALL